MNFSNPVILIKKQVAELERYSIWMTKMRNICMPVAISCMLLIFIPHGANVLESVLMIGLVVSIFIVSTFYRNYSVRERYRVLKSEIEELEALGK